MSSLGVNGLKEIFLFIIVSNTLLLIDLKIIIVDSWNALINIYTLVESKKNNKINI